VSSSDSGRVHALAPEPGLRQRAVRVQHSQIRPSAGAQAADRHDPGAILVTDRQMEQQVLHTVDTEPAQALGILWTDALECSDGGVGERGGWIWQTAA